MNIPLSGDSTMEITRSFPRISFVNSINNCDFYKEIRLSRSGSGSCPGLEIEALVFLSATQQLNVQSL